MTPRSGIIAGGNWIIDRVKLIDLWPPQDSLAVILSQSASNGGGPYNLLKDLARLGAPFPLSAIGLLGEDADGRSIIADCRSHGINTDQLQLTPHAPTSGTDVMTVASTGRRTFFHQAGANALLAPEHFDFSTTTAKIFYLGYLLLLQQLDDVDEHGHPRALQVLRRARAAGLRVALDCVSESSDRFTRLVAPVLPEVDLLFANDFEAEKLTGLRLRTDNGFEAAAVEAAAHRLITMGVGEWVVLHLPEAVHARSVHGEALWQPSVRLPAEAIAGTAGAGDALAAGVLLGLHEEWPMARALEVGVCTAAASLRHPSCSDDVVPVRECLQLGERYGFRTLPA